MTEIEKCQNLEGYELDACIVEHLTYFEYNISGETFKEKFMKFGGEESMANHLWEKFHGYNHSILSSWGALDKQNKEIMIKVIDSGWK